MKRSRYEREPKYAEFFDRLVGQLPDAEHGVCTEVDAGDFWIAYNPHGERTYTTRGQWLDPRHAYIEYLGNPSAMITKDGGMTLSSKGRWTFGQLVATVSTIGQ